MAQEIEARTAKPSKRAGRSARRRARREAGIVASAPFIHRRVGVYELLSEEALELIEANADKILKDVGMEFRGDSETLDIFRKAKADVQGERVRFEPGFCRSTIRKSAPAIFTQHARNPKKSVQIGGDAQVYCPSFGPPFVHDMEAGRRYATFSDFENLTRLHHMLSPVHHSGGVVCEPVDIDVPERHLLMAKAHLTLNDKPFMGAVTAPERAKDTIEMVRLAFGEKFVDGNCCLYSVVNTNAPLVLDQTMIGALKEYAKANQCVVASPFVLAGAMSPVSVVGTLSQVLAEVLASLCLIQLIRPGAPCAFGTFASPISLRTGAPTFGTPEGMQFQICASALARRLGVPFHSVGALTASKVPDAQAGYESALQLAGAVHAGVNFIIHATGCLEGLLTTGFEKTVMDADRCAALQRFTLGVDLSEEAQALDAIEEVGPGNHYLGCAHTRRNFERAFHMSEMADNSTYEQWKAEGALWEHQRAHERFRKMLREYEPPPIDPGLEEALNDFVERRLGEMRAS